MNLQVVVFFNCEASIQYDDTLEYYIISWDTFMQFLKACPFHYIYTIYTMQPSCTQHGTMMTSEAVRLYRISAELFIRLPTFFWSYIPGHAWKCDHIPNFLESRTRKAPNSISVCFTCSLNRRILGTGLNNDHCLRSVCNFGISSSISDRWCLILEPWWRQVN